nr:ATP-binding cassette domain-containing protein [Propylenella binzhouense]
MVGSRPAALRPRQATAPGRSILRAEGVAAAGDRGHAALDGLDLDVRAGEIFGIIGVAGNGQPELAEVLAGLRRASRGRILLDGTDISRWSPLRRMRAGLRFVPEDRMGMGMVMPLDIPDNMMLRDFRDPPFVRRGLIDHGAARRRAEEAVAQYGVSHGGLGRPVRLLSGGNQQKLLLAREIWTDPKLLLVSQPTRGLDVAAARAVHDRLVALRDGGSAVLLVSEDLDEVLQLADRAAVMYGGRITGIWPAARFDRDGIGAAMGGGIPRAAA